MKPSDSQRLSLTLSSLPSSPPMSPTLDMLRITTERRRTRLLGAWGGQIKPQSPSVMATLVSLTGICNYLGDTPPGLSWRDFQRVNRGPSLNVGSSISPRSEAPRWMKREQRRTQMENQHSTLCPLISCACCGASLPGWTASLRNEWAPPQTFLPWLVLFRYLITVMSRGASTPPWHCA